MPGTDAFAEATKKRKMDATGKAPWVKHAKAPRKNKGEPVKVAAPQGKTGLKWPTEAEVASARSFKQSKKIASNPAAATRDAVGASSCKGAAGVKRAAAHVRKHHIPTSRMLAEASSTESHESSPHGQMPQGSLPEIVSRPELETVLRSEPEAPLEITPVAGTGGASFLSFVVAIAAS
jgi:hypothetical protein